MAQTASKTWVNDVLKSINITVNGSHTDDIQIHNDNFYARVLQHGALGLGESYMDGWWDCPHLDVFFEKILRSGIDQQIKPPLRVIINAMMARIINPQSKIRAKDVAHKHYDLGNDLFTHMLDSRMIYSCGYWKDANNLEDAQTAKLDLICRKLQLQPGMRLLDIGCGWGGLAKYAAERYQANVTGVTISEQQASYAKQYCQGLPVDIQLIDYRDVQGKFDRIASVGMFEHVGHVNYPTYMATAHRLLADNGLLLLHTIGNNESGFVTNEWTTKYIFPHGELPSIADIAKASEKLFVMEDWHNFGADYDLTLMAWFKNFIDRWQVLKHTYDQRFYRMWTYYLLSSAGGFRARAMQLWQIVFAKKGLMGGYRAPR